MKFFLSHCLLVLFFVSISASTMSQSIEVDKGNRKLMHPPPVPNFYITGLCYGDTTHFINKTDIGTIYWSITNDKGDTLYSVQSENAKYYFKKKGYYNISLKADNGHIAIKTRTVLVDTVTRAAFSFRNCINEFDNLSSCADQFIWTLPDNVLSIDTFPSYQFKNAGNFLVRLMAKRGNKLNEIIQTVSIPADSLGIPKSVFTFKRHGTSNVFDLQAVDSLANRYDWNFGDRTFDDSSGYKVTHTFDVDKYNGSVILRVANGCGFSFYEANPFGVTGIEDGSFLLHNVVVYPNPAQTEVDIAIFNLQQSKPVDIKLIDRSGVVLREYKLIITTTSSSLKLDTTLLSKGIYLIQIHMDDQLINKKLVVQ